MLEIVELEQLACVRDTLREIRAVIYDDFTYRLVKDAYLNTLSEAIKRNKLSDKEAIRLFSAGGKRDAQIEMRNWVRQFIRNKLNSLDV